MTYNVQIVGSGYLGWKFLERTEEKQREIFAKSTEIARARDYYREKMPNVHSADQLVSDRRLLDVTLRAFGLEADLTNRAFIKKILDADATDPASFVNKIADKKYLAMNLAFAKVRAGGDGGEDNVIDIIGRYENRLFERNIGERYPEIEIALNAQRELQVIASKNTSAKTKWYEVIASKSLKKFFEAAFGFGVGFSGLSVDQQLDGLARGLNKMLGASDLSHVLERGEFEMVTKIFLLRHSNSSADGDIKYNTALKLLRKG